MIKLTEYHTSKMIYLDATVKPTMIKPFSNYTGIFFPSHSIFSTDVRDPIGRASFVKEPPEEVYNAYYGETGS